MFPKISGPFLAVPIITISVFGSVLPPPPPVYGNFEVELRLLWPWHGAVRLRILLPGLSYPKQCEGQVATSLGQSSTLPHRHNKIMPLFASLWPLVRQVQREIYGRSQQVGT